MFPTKSDEASAAGPALKSVQSRPRWLVYLGATWLLAIIIAAVFGPWLGLPDYGPPLGKARSGPDGTLRGAARVRRNRPQLLSRVVNGARVSLLVGAISGLIGFVVGTTLGLLAGFLRGRVDTLVSFLADGLLAFPPLVLLLAVASVLEPSVTTLIVALSIVVVPTFTRLSRANTLRWSSREFVTAATNMGAGPLRLMMREILPNLVPSVAAYLPIVIAALIVAEGSLSFLGLGIPPPTPSWGGMINSGQGFLAKYPLLVIVPATAIFLTVFSLNVVGDHLRSEVRGAVTAVTSVRPTAARSFRIRASPRQGAT